MFTIFDRDALLEALKGQAKFYRIGGRDSRLYKTLETEIGQVAQPLSIEEWDARMTEIARGDTNANNNVAIASSNSVQVTKNISSEADPYYADEIPPFDITISFANEYGQMARVVLYAVEILNEGSGFSIDNVTSEKACTFVARRVDYLHKVDRNGTSDSASSTDPGGA